MFSCQHYGGHQAELAVTLFVYVGPVVSNGEIPLAGQLNLRMYV